MREKPEEDRKGRIKRYTDPALTVRFRCFLMPLILNASDTLRAQGGRR
jgi:hypothetical protein